MQGQQKDERDFIFRNLWRALLFLVVIVVLFLLGKKYVSDRYLEWLEPLTSRPLLVYSIFLISETIIGVLPPDFFIMWSLSDSLWEYCKALLFLAFLSYLGGIMAFWMGKWLHRSKLLQRLITSKRYRKQLDYFHKYGGILIATAAVTPLPFAVVSTMAGSLGFGFSRYFQYAIFRIFRFAIYGAVIWVANSGF